MVSYCPKKAKAVIFLALYTTANLWMTVKRKKNTNHTPLQQDERGCGYRRPDVEKLFLQKVDTEVADSSLALHAWYCHTKCICQIQSAAT